MRIDRIIGRRRIVAALAAGALLVPAGPAQAGGPLPIRVNSTADDPDYFSGAGVCDTTFPPTDDCTLRAAIETANADPDEDIIVFDIPGIGVHVIMVPSPLPSITEPLIIKGYTQRGSRPNTATKGSNARLRVVLRNVPIYSDLGLTALAKVTVRGLVIQNFDTGLYLSADGSVVAGNFIGSTASGMSPARNDFAGVTVVESTGVIGGPKPKDRNLICCGINGITGSSPFIGGLKIQGNLIGVAADGVTPLGNSYTGVRAVHNVLIGGDSAARANVIAYNGGPGIHVQSQRVTVARNSIFANGGLGIDLDGDGPTPNDGVPDSDVGPNGLQNFPVLSSTKTVASTTTIKGTLRTMPLHGFDLRFFSSGPGAPPGTGRVFLMKRTVITNANGRVDFTFVTPDKVAIGRVITATATSRTLHGTSEFSAGRTVTGP